MSNNPSPQAIAAVNVIYDYLVSDVSNNIVYDEKTYEDKKKAAAIIDEECHIKKTLELIDEHIDGAEKTISMTTNIPINAVAEAKIVLLTIIKKALEGGE